MLRRNANAWIDGPDLSNERVGGSEGLRRLRELAQEGHRIQQRRHPNPDRDIWQYRLVVDQPVSPVRGSPPATSLRSAVKQGADGQWEYIPAEPEIVKVTEVEGAHSEYQFTEMPSKIDFGDVAVCPRCHAKTARVKYGSSPRSLHKDPYVKGPCQGCRGWGIVPNRGAVPITMPEGMDHGDRNRARG